MMSTDGCNLCGDQGPLVLRARCHLTAPLQVSVEDDIMTIRCYVPECGRVVARYRIAARLEAPELPGGTEGEKR